MGDTALTTLMKFKPSRSGLSAAQQAPSFQIDLRLRTDGRDALQILKKSSLRARTSSSGETWTLSNASSLCKSGGSTRRCKASSGTKAIGSSTASSEACTLSYKTP